MVSKVPTIKHLILDMWGLRVSIETGLIMVRLLYLQYSP